MSHFDNPQTGSDRIQTDNGDNASRHSMVEMSDPSQVRSVFKPQDGQSQSIAGADGKVSFGDVYKQVRDECGGAGGGGEAHKWSSMSNPDQLLHQQISHVQKELGQIGNEIAQLFGGQGQDNQASTLASDSQTSAPPATSGSDGQNAGTPGADSQTSAPPATSSSDGQNAGTPGADSQTSAPPATSSSDGQNAGTPGADSQKSAPPATAGSDSAPPATTSSDSTTPTTTSSDNSQPSSTIASGDNSGFTINNGQMLINGKLMAGVAVTGEYAQQVGPQALAAEMEKDYPGINVVRLSTSPEGGAFTNGTTLQGGETIDNINQTIQALNADGIGVIVDNHGSDANTSNNVSQDGAEASWFSQLAQANLGNNMVAFQPENEPIGSDSDIVNEQQTAYNAIRATGSQNIVAFDLEGGGGVSPMLSNPAAYNADTNYAFDVHAYASNSSDPAASTAAEIAQLNGFTEGNGGGVVPKYLGETGNSIDGSNIDPMASAQLQTDMTDGDRSYFLGARWCCNRIRQRQWCRPSDRL